MDKSLGSYLLECSFISVLLYIIPNVVQAQVKTLSLPGFEWHEPTAWSPIGVPTASDSVIIGGETFIQSDSLARALHVTITAEGQLLIKRDLALNKPGKLVINNAPGDAIFNEGKLINGGRITINTAGGVGLNNYYGELEIWDHAKLVIDSTFDIGLKSYNAPIKVDGLISIERSGLVGLYIHGDSVKVGETGQLSFLNCYKTSIRIVGASTYLENKGFIDIDSSGEHGIYSSGSLINYDTISISTCENDLLSNLDSLTNHEGAVILLNNSKNNHGLYSDGYCLNNGEIKIDQTDDVALYAHTEFYNFGKISCSNAGDGGVYLEEGIFLNNGHLEVSHCHTGLYVESTSHFVNIDSFVMDSIDVFGIYNTDSITNDGYLSISNCRESGAIGIYNADYTTVILNTGKVELYNIDSIALQNRSEFINEDTLLIEGIYDIGIYNEDSIYNGISGYIDIRSINAEKPAIININGTFHNRNVVQIDNCEGMGIANSGYILNEDSISLSGLLSFGILNYKVFDNRSQSYLSIRNIHRSLDADNVAIKGDSDRIVKVSDSKSCSEPSDNVAFDNNGAFGTALLNNNGLITMRDADVGLINSGLITNVDSIEIDEVRLGISTCYPMVMTMEPIDVTIDNDGYISMGTDDGMIVGGGTVFNVGALGELIIRSSDDDMLQVSLEAIFDCAGILDVSELKVE